MKLNELKVEKRESFGNGHSRVLRRSGRVPAILYGRDFENQAISLDLKEFKNLIKASGNENSIVTLILPEGKQKKVTAMIREVQRDPLTQNVVHVDFHKISMDEEITTHVRIEFVGSPAGVKDGGVLEHRLRHVEVSCLPTNIPEEIQVDVSNLAIGDFVRVENIPHIDGVTILTLGDEVVASVTPPTELKVEEIAVSEEEKEPELIKPEKEKEKETESKGD
ncbi:MAG: 50S ribosomal protein L25/general stress protein Ctc [Actinobacteria bacterium]|nr:50S ribosomal protein L25/general stress protein Ctc [Actinomycetota bacterium]